MPSNPPDSQQPSRVPRIVHILFGGLGGHGSVVFSLIKASRGAALHELAFVSTGELLTDYRAKCERDGITYVHERTSGGADLGFQWRLFRWILARRPDTVVVHSTGSVGAALAVKLLGRHTRIVVVEHQSWDLRGRRYNIATTLSLLAADNVLVLTEDYARKLRGHFPRLSRRVSIDVVRNGIDTDHYVPRPMPSWPAETLLIGMQSRIIPIKDHATLIRAIHLLRERGLDVHLELAGDGSSRGDLEALVSDLDLRDRVTFRGMLNESELVEFLQGLDIYVHASLGEAMSTALLQAMSCGLPVVASDVPGIADLVAGSDAAILVPPQSPEPLADVVASLCADPKGRESLGKAAREFVMSGYSLDAMWQSYGPFLVGTHGRRSAGRGGSAP